MKYFLFVAAFLAASLCGAQNKKSAVFSESDVTLKTPTGSISGSLTVPQNIIHPPVVLIIAGSGPTDRDGNSRLGVSTDMYKMLARDLAAKGIASLRYDKRGIGKSSSAMTREEDLRFDTYADDAAGWISMLKSDSRFSRTVVLGHSEGSLLGMIAARHAHADAFISLAGAGRPADKILEEQLSNLPPGLMIESRTIIASLKSGRTVAKTDPQLAAVFRPSVQPYMISWMKFDPAAELAKLTIPVLIIQGTTDLQTSVNDAKLLSASSPKGLLRLMEKMNHILKEADAGVQENAATYRNPNLPLFKGLADEISTFILMPAAR